MMCCTCQTSKGDPNTSCYMPLLEDIWEVYPWILYYQEDKEE